MTENAKITGCCRYCSGPYKAVFHDGVCPRVSAIEYHPDGTVKRVEFAPVDRPLSATKAFSTAATSAATASEAIKALTDAISGQIVGRSASAGQIVRY